MVSRQGEAVSAERRARQSIMAVNLGLVSNVLLAVLKTAIGVLGSSPALLADGINSTSDVAYSIVVSVFMRRATKPPDHEHPYGHSQLESIAALVVGSFVVTTAIAVFWNAVSNVYDLVVGEGTFAGATITALWVALFTVLIKIGLTAFTQRIGKQTENAAVWALGYDHRNDVISAAGAALGIFLGRRGYPWVDPLAGAFVAMVILRTGIEILRQSSDDLMDTVPGHTLARQIDGLLSSIPGVVQAEEIHAHRFGPYLVINVTIGVDGSLTVVAGDEIASRVERILCRQVEFVRRVHVHYHPAGIGSRAQLDVGTGTNGCAPSSS